ncbi:hypothetical protein PGAG_00247 [Phaeocystis globosa virus 12T]|nr:hypothetical protein PGAG_00247 [Phaeocystis globosa virus 12T]AET73960.1 hypothetical protein PGBG_00252 [Phaeocystis globosa virus 14T]
MSNSGLKFFFLLTEKVVYAIARDAATAVKIGPRTLPPTPIRAPLPSQEPADTAPCPAPASPNVVDTIPFDVPLTIASPTAPAAPLAAMFSIGIDLFFCPIAACSRFSSVDFAPPFFIFRLPFFFLLINYSSFLPLFLYI